MSFHVFDHGHNHGHKKKRKILWIVGILIVLAIVLFFIDQKDIFSGNGFRFGGIDKTKTELGVMMDKSAPALDEMAETPQIITEYDYEGKLADVSGGVGSGVAKSTFTDGTYSLFAEFEHIPKPKKNYFYEGWVVRRIPFHFISTGKIEFVNGTYTNIYTSSQDLTDHNFYVLTIEPDDGDPRPADHVLEGVIEQK